MPKLCKLRLGNILYIWFYMVSEPLWHTSFFFFFPLASSSSSTSVVNTTTSSPTSLTTIHHLITIKLTCDNYLLWKAQIVLYLKGQNLFGYLDGSTLAPPQSLTVETDGDIQVSKIRISVTGTYKTRWFSMP